tara:strand:+ start:346 stop:498 length:153 start_codon:yes stop_codon:yes gene_type:complete
MGELKTKWKLFYVDGYKHKIVIHPNEDKTAWKDWVITNEHENKTIAKGEL